MKRRSGRRRATHQVETGQGCRPAGKDKDFACLVRQALWPSGRLVCGFFIRAWMPLLCSSMISFLLKTNVYIVFISVHSNRIHLSRNLRHLGSSALNLGMKTDLSDLLPLF